MPANICDSLHGLTLANAYDSAEQNSPETKSQPELRNVRLARHKSQCEKLIEYLHDKKCRPELSKKETRNIKNKAATHKFDSTSKCPSHLYVVYMFSSLCCLCY